MHARDGHVRVLPIAVANKIAAGEVVERPASVVKELVENAIDAGARSVRIAITAGGRKLISVMDDGCGMSRDDAVLSLERQATSKILDVDDIERIDTLGFRGEAIPSIASVSRFTLTTRRHDSDEGTFLAVNAGTLAEVRTAGCPPGTLVEVRDLFCNVPARRKFLRAYATEEGHVRGTFTVHALAHPEIGFALVIDGREIYRLAPAASSLERIRDLFGTEAMENFLPLREESIDERDRRETATGEAESRENGIRKPGEITVTGFIEKPNLALPTRRDQYIFVNGRPATAPSIAYAIREAYPRHQGDVRPAAILFINLPPDQVDVNVHPTKREVRFRNNVALKAALTAAIETALASRPFANVSPGNGPLPLGDRPLKIEPPVPGDSHPIGSPSHSTASGEIIQFQQKQANSASARPLDPPVPAPVPLEFALDSDSPRAKPWNWFHFLAQTASGYLLIETDAGVVTLNPLAARERIAYERLMASAAAKDATTASQTLLIPETVHLPPVDAARIRTLLPIIAAMGFSVEDFGQDTFKIDAVPQLLGSLSPSGTLATVAQDLAEAGTRRGGEKWREDLIAKSIARSFAGASLALTEEDAVRLVEDLCNCRMPYVCPRGKPVMIFTSTRELNRKFNRI